MRIDGRAGLLLLQPGVFGIDTPRLTADAPAPRLTDLRDALCATYPAGHPAIFIRSATATMSKQQFQTTVDKLDEVPSSALAASTLWIPPLDLGRPRSAAEQEAARAARAGT
jgi:hypothetical protein